MPQIGGVFVPDNLMPDPTPSNAPRPGLASIFGAAAEQTLGQLRYGLPYAFKALTETAHPADTALYAKGLADAQAAGDKAAPAQVSDLTSGRVGIGRFVAENLAASIPQMAGSLAGGVAGGFLGGPGGAVEGAIAGGVPTFIGSNVGRSVQENGDLDHNAAFRSVVAAVPQAASDALVERYLPGAGKLFGDIAATQAGGFLARTVKSIAKAAGTEAVTEAGQQLGERFAAGKPLTTPDAVAEYTNAAVTAMAVGGALGAGGGFRRMEAHRKAAADVTPDDLAAAVDNVLSPKPLALPAPADFIGRSGEAPAVNPAGNVQLALPSPDQFRAPDAMTDSRGVTAMNPDAERALVIDRNQPVPSFVPPTPGELQARMDALRTPVPDVLAAPSAALDPQAAVNALENFRNTGTSPLAIDASGRFNGTANTVEAAAGPRIFGDQPHADLMTALRAKDASPEIKAEAQREVDMRRAEAAGLEPLTGDFKQRLDELKDGLRGGWVQKLTAENPTELTSKVYDEVFENQNTSANVTKLAQRMGLLDDKLEPTPRAAEIEQQRTAALQADTAATTVPPARTAIEAAPVDPAFNTEWEQLKQAAGIGRTRMELKGIGTPANLEDARQKVFAALADDSANVEHSQVEKVAQQMGLITNDDFKDVTKLGRETFLRSGQGLEETVSAAQQQGYTGTQASIFESGVRAQLDGNDTVASHTSFADMAAYQAGKAWARDYTTNPGVRTGAQTAAIQARQETRATGEAVDRRVLERQQLTPDQVRQQAMNRLLDAADLRTASDSDVAQLRRMVRDGASADDVANALQQVQGGKTLFTQPEPQTRTIPADLPQRGQPRFREMNTDVEASRTAQRTETEGAVRAFRLRSLVDFARENGGITAARAEKLHGLLNEGKVDQVARNMKSFDPDGKAAFGTNQFGWADPKLEAALTGKTFAEAGQYMIDNAPSPFHREVMEKVMGMAKQIAKADGHTLELKVVNPGDIAPKAISHPDVMAWTRSDLGAHTSTVYLKGARMSPEVGVNYQMAAHEMLHAVTMEALEYARATDPEGKTQLGKAVNNLRDLASAVQRHVRDRLDNTSIHGLEALRGEGDMAKLEFELQHQLGEHNAFADMHEILAWGLTNPRMQQYLNSIEYKPKQSVFSRLVQLVRDMLGLKSPHAETALTELMRVSEQVLGTDARELQRVYARDNPDALEDVQLEAAAGRPGAATARDAVSTNDAVKGLSELTDRVTQAIPLADLGVKARRVALGWISQNHMDREFGAAMPGLLARSEAKRAHDAIQGRFAGMGDQSYQNYERLLREDRPNAERMVQLMALSTEFKIDPDKAWDAHAHLKGADNVATLKRLHGEAVKLKNDLSRGDGAGYKLYTEMRQRNEAMNYARMAGELHSIVALDPEFALGVAGANVNPMDTFMLQPGLSEAADIRNHWHAALMDQIKAATTFINKKKGEAAAGTPADQRGMSQHLAPIEAKINSIHEALGGMARSPYFHLGRFGDNFASATIRKGANGVVDPKAQAHVAKVLADAGFSGIQLSADNTKPKFMARLETVDQTNRMKSILLDLQKQGWLDKEEHILAGPRDLEKNYGVADGMPAFVERYIKSIEESPTFVPDEGMSATEKAQLAERKAEAIQLARDTWIEQQPDSAISKVLTARDTVPGFDPDMMRSFAHRWTVGSAGLARVATSASLGKAYEDMRAQKREALDAADPQNADRLNDVFNEVRKRDAARPLDPTANVFDKLRAISHSYFLGFSPAYGLVNMTQLGVTALPELAKTAGYNKSFHAMRRASTVAFRIMNAARQEAFALGPKNAADVVLTESVLQKAGLSTTQADFMRHMIATGTIDIGTSARALGQVAKGQGHTKLDTYLKYAGAMGLYTETFSRLVTALAAHDLHGGGVQDAAKFATKVVSNSMFDYQSWNTARQLGKQGFAGPITPLLTQFMQYSAQVTEKLYSEAHDAVGRQRPGETAEAAAERRAASRTFLAGHLVGVTALAGTLGMPFATVFATAAEKMFGSDDEPFDATAAYRNFLASIFGKDVAEVIARGLPRAVGVDLSQRAGEQNLLPFSEFLSDKRSWREASQGYVGRSIGAAPDMLLNVADAGNQFANGDVLGGMKAMLPVAFKGPTEAYRMSVDGYVDTKGNKLPMQPGAQAILAQLLGFAPSEKAEYSEARGDQAARRMTLTQRAASLRNQIVKSITSGDDDNARLLLGEAQAFDQANPTYAVIPSLGGALQRQARSRVTARVAAAPLGVDVNDLAGRSLTGYANVNYQ